MALVTDDDDDPVMWSVDRVIYELCHNPEPSWADSQHVLLAATTSVEECFRAQEVSGDVLLGLEDADIKNELGITTFGQRRKLINVVALLRGQSRYYARQQQRDITLSSRYSNGLSQGRALPHPTNIHRSIEDEAKDASTVGIQAPNMTSTPLHIHQPSSNIEVLGLSHHNGSSRSRLKIESAAGDESLDILDRLSDHVQAQQDGDERRIMHNLSSGEDRSRHSSGTKRKRAPSESSIDKVDGAMGGSQGHSQRTGLEVERLSLLAQFQKGPKRVQPTLISQTTATNSFGLQSTVQNTAHVAPSPDQQTQRYVVASPDDDLTDFRWLAPHSRPAMTQVVAKHMRRYLIPGNHAAVSRSEQNSRRVETRIRGLQQKNHAHGKINRKTDLIADRYEMQWPSDFNNIVDRPKSLAEPNTGNRPQTIANSSNEKNLGPYQYLLEKYPPGHEDDILPLYGDSDEDDQYLTVDSDSNSDQNDAMPENGTLSTRHLSANEVDIIINQALADIKRRWHQYRLEKVQRKAHGLWQAARQSPVTKTNILTALERTHTLASKRLPKIRESIQASTWTGTIDLQRQCESFEATVHQVEEHAYCLSVLNSEQEPALPKYRMAPVRTRRSMVINDEIECESSGTDMNDFIDNDSDAEIPSNDVEFHDFLPMSVFSPGGTAQEVESDTSQSKPHGTSEVGTQDAEDFELPDIEYRLLQSTQEEQSQSSHIKQEVPSSFPLKETTKDHVADANEGEIEVVHPIRRTDATVQGSRATARHRNVSDMHDSSEEADIERWTPIRRKVRWSTHGDTLSQPIDLSILDSPPARKDELPDDLQSGVRTPELNPVEFVNAKDSPGVESRMLNDADRALSDLPQLEAVQKLRWSSIENDPDGHALGLAKAITALAFTDLLFVSEHARRHSELTLQDALQAGLNYLKSDDETVIDVAEKDRRLTMHLTKLYYSYACVAKFEEDDVAEEDLDIAWNLLRDHVGSFRKILIALLNQFVKPRSRRAAVSQSDSEETNSVVSAISISSNDSDSATTSQVDPKNSRRRLFRRAEKAELRKLQQRNERSETQQVAQDRVKDQERRKALLTARLARRLDKTGIFSVPVNFREPTVTLDQHIARAIKPHQVEGLQFLWRELIEDDQHHGGLLAHTMGLGKTMQVVALLVTIAQCNAASNALIRAYIPESMRDLRVLILCPPSLVENWYDELLFWMPKHDSLGPIIKVSSPNEDPFQNVSSWAKDRGVLIMSYTRLHLYTSRATLQDPQPFAGHSTQFNRDSKMMEWLTQLPSIVVADEAHVLKNPDSKVSRSVSKIKTKSRIALTGSPLSNHIEEYWAMINFISPGYLGDLASFRRKFVWPINASLAADSGPYDRRVGLKKMHVLREILGPKVHRADISAIRSDLPSKTEFFITVPLTDLQKTAYQIFVSHCRSATAQGAGKSRTANLFHWIAILTLLCNHPHAFVNKLRKPRAFDDPSRNRQKLSSVEEIDVEPNYADDVDISDEPAITEGMRKAAAVFSDIDQLGQLDDPSLSYRAQLVRMIVTETMVLEEKVLIFSHSLPTLDYLELLLQGIQCRYVRVDGGMAAYKRQDASKQFNSEGSRTQAFLISTRAGGLGLNLQGATRVILFDSSFNPTWEEQAVGRAYRLGQKHPVFVYRFRAGGTFEDVMFNLSVFKTQLFTRVIDHRAIQRKASKLNAELYFADARNPDQHDLTQTKGRDPYVMDKILATVSYVRNIELTETFAEEIVEVLTAQEAQEAEQDLAMERLARTNPAAYEARQNARAIHRQFQGMGTQLQQPGAHSSYTTLVNAINTPISELASRANRPWHYWSPGVTNVVGKANGDRRSFDDSIRVPQDARNILPKLGGAENSELRPA